ncbi:hypothetical protein PC9H_003255 [Pleurotus ostreatus]|uniref:Protein kinase domain-containing protein n=1 Tax=Pleurotus ostreatus TaxID=5322 RepID=A0A8H7A0L4_PLEOS|nr:uncharacterized protein PC9H_003255 [Pleurotus ostreatus]KAF7436422.1 hypothetical protein PC9H_003255 [Pleurotus ostreatus]
MSSLTLIWANEAAPVSGNNQVLQPWITQPATSNANLVCRIHTRIRSRLFVGSINGIPGPLAIKFARDGYEVETLQKEIQFYDKSLKTLQGDVVPKVFGGYRGRADGVDIAVFIMEYCQSVEEPDAREFNRKVMLAACKLHAAGVMHRNLLASHHIISTVKGLRFVDFSDGIMHRCPGANPQVQCVGRGNQPVGCFELDVLEQTYGQYSDAGITPKEPFHIFGGLDGSKAVVGRRTV